MIERKTMLISPVQLMSFRANGETRSPLKDVIDPPMPKKVGTKKPMVNSTQTNQGLMWS